MPVRIPPGVTDGSRVRVSGEGEHGSGGAQSGDLYLRIRLAPHPRFEEKGRGAHTEGVRAADDGGARRRSRRDHAGGRSLRLRIPPLTQNSQVFRLKGHGMPAIGKSDEVGDLYATVDVEMPRDLTPEQRAHFEELKKLDTGTKNSAA